MFKNISKFLIIASVVILNACGGGGGSSNKTPDQKTNLTVSIVSFDNFESNVSRTPSIQLQFSEAMDPATLTNANIKLQTAAGSDVSISAITPGSGNEVSFYPLNPLVASAVYQVVVTAGVLDLNGNSVVPQTFTFTTGTIIIPTVAMISPADAESNVASKPFIQLQFSESMNSATVTNANIKLRDASGTDIPIGSITGGLLNRFGFSPSNLLVESMTYQVVVTAGVLDIGGNSVVAQSFTFTTAQRGFIYKTAPTSFKVDLARFKLLSTSNVNLANEIQTRFPYRSLGTVANLNIFNSMNMFRMRVAGHSSIYEVLNVETASGAEYATISYPGTTVVTGSFEVDAQSFSKLFLFDDSLIPQSYANFKVAHSLTDLQMQKLVFAIVASGIGGSPVYEISLLPGTSSNELDVELTGGFAVNLANYSPNVISTYLSSPYHILPGDYDSVEVKFQHDLALNPSESIVLNKVMKFIRSNNDIPNAITNGLFPTNYKEQLMFIGMLLKLSGNHYLGSSSFGAVDSPDYRGPFGITQLRMGDIFPTLAANLAGRLTDPSLYNDLFFSSDFDGCIDVLGANAIWEARHLL